MSPCEVTMTASTRDACSRGMMVFRSDGLELNQPMRPRLSQALRLARFDSLDRPSSYPTWLALKRREASRSTHATLICADRDSQRRVTATGRR